jgi:hypothetical protein
VTAAPGGVAPEDLAAMLRHCRTVDDPITGEVAPAEMEARSPLWPDARRWQRIELKHVTEQGPRRIEEYRFTPAAGYTPPVKYFDSLPVAIVYERGAHGDRNVRVYSAHELVADRKPILPVVENLHPERGADDILKRYFDALHAADVDATLATFDDAGYMQHSNGERHVGRDRLRAAFIKFFKPGPINLRYCNKTDGGDITALECYMPSGRPAVAVYHRASRDQMLAARLYL